MHYSTVYVGMDTHKETFSLCCLELYGAKADDPAIRKARRKMGAVIEVPALYADMTAQDNLKQQYQVLGLPSYDGIDELLKLVGLDNTGKKKVKTDKRDAALIARCLAHHDYSPVHIPTDKDEQVKEFIRMRDDHKLALKKVKQQILSFCLRHNYRFDGTSSHWTQSHLKWLRALSPEGLY